MKDKRISIDLDIEDLLGLTEPNKNSLEYDLNFIIENGIDKKMEFIELFKECFDELCVFMEKDDKRRVPISCFTCIKGMDLRDQYGKPKRK